MEEIKFYLPIHEDRMEKLWEEIKDHVPTEHKKINYDLFNSIFSNS